MSTRTPGLFITGTDTEIGKTYVAALIARSLAARGLRVGVYKPAASGCVPNSPLLAKEGLGEVSDADATPSGSPLARGRTFESPLLAKEGLGEVGGADVTPPSPPLARGGMLVSEDAVALWEAAGRPGTLAQVCPQLFAAPLAPHLAARAEGKEIDAALLRTAVRYWQENSDIVLVEGAGGLMSPLGDEDYVAELAYDLGYPLVVVSPNRLGTINATLQTLITAATFRDGLDVAGVVLNEVSPHGDDASTASNFAELAARCVPPVLAHVKWQAETFDEAVDWMALAGGRV